MMRCDICRALKPLSNWSCQSTIGDQETKFHENVCVDCSEALLLVSTTVPDVVIELKKKCECCGRAIDGESIYHPGTHKYVCSYACFKYETEVLVTTFGPLEKPDG